MATISRRSPPVVVEYTCRGNRKTKHFADPYAARRLYVAKFNAGKEPRIRKP